MDGSANASAPRAIVVFRWLLVSCLVALGCGTEAMPLPESPLEARVALLRAVHPAPERTLPRADLDVLVDRFRGHGSEGSIAEAFALRRVVAELGDSHLAVGLPAPAPEEATFAPFLVKRVGERYLVDAGEGLAVGDEVVAIDGEAIETLMARLAELSTVDGDRPAVRLAEAERRFTEHLRLDLGARDEWSITTRPIGSEERVTHRLAGITVGELAALERQSAPVWGEPSPLPTLSTHGDVSVLRLATFGNPDRESFLETIASLAPELAVAGRLVIDLRGNEGGDRSLGIAVARHLLAEPFTQWRSVSARVRAIPEPFAPHVRFVFGATEDSLEGFVGEPVEGGWRVDGDPLAELMEPAEPSYRGPLVLFVDDATNSAAVELAVALQAHHDDVTVIGTETQGECGWHVGQLPILYDDERGAPLLLSLFAIEHVSSPGCVAGRGIQPDVVVELSLGDFTSGRDPFLRALGVP